jgi:hypothetical protein
MARNNKVLGIITTMTGWVFLRRENGGRLLMTRMFGCNASDALRQREYILPNTFTISLALYYFSALAESTFDVQETTGDPPQLVYFPSASTTSAAAPFIQPPQPTQFQHEQLFPADYQNPLPYPYVNFPHVAFLFEPWKSEHRLGRKTWVANIHSNFREDRVIFKLWDSWKATSRDRDNEVAMYKHLKPLWGICVPSLLAFGPVDFCHGLVIDYIHNVLLVVTPLIIGHSIVERKPVYQSREKDNERIR